MLFSPIVRRLVLLCASAILSGCAFIPESAYYHPSYEDHSCATISPGRGGWNYRVHYSLMFVPPTFTSVAAIDGKIVRTSFWLGSTTMPIPSGKHLLTLECHLGEEHTFSELPAYFAPNAHYSVKSEFTSKNLHDLNFFIEENTTKRRIAEGPATHSYSEVHIPIYIPVTR